MAKVAKLKWDFKAYSGVYIDKKTSNEALITYGKSGLVLKVRGAINAVFVVDPQVIGKKVSVNSIQKVCRQLREEYRNRLLITVAEGT
jgi:hypothetical protein